MAGASGNALPPRDGIREKSETDHEALSFLGGSPSAPTALGVHPAQIL